VALRLSHHWVAWYKLTFGCWFVQPIAVHMKDINEETNKLFASFTSGASRECSVLLVILEVVSGRPCH
jgi:hypothetical protein